MWVQDLEQLQNEVHSLAISKGFWSTGRTTAHCIALIHSELSEALEADRDLDENGRDHFAEELADAVIRILDLAGANDVNLAAAILKKHGENKNRPYLHGKKY